MSTRSRSITAKVQPVTGPTVKVTTRGSKRARTQAEESDEGSHGKNRHRVTRACNECRRRKDRCDGQRPSCMSCIEGRRSCSYGPSKKRGLRTGYVRAIEVLLGLIFTTIEGSEQWICGLLEGKAEQTTFQAVSDSEFPDTSAEFLLDAWRKNSVAKELGKLLAPEGIEDEEDGTDPFKYFDTKAAEALALSLASRDFHAGAHLTPMNTDTTPQDVPSINSSATPLVNYTSLESIEDECLIPQGSLSNEPEPATPHYSNAFLNPTPQLPSNWPHLLDLYLETSHSCLPISQKHELLRTAYTLANDTASTTAITSGESAFLRAVLIYASHQSTTITNYSGTPIKNPCTIKSPQALTHTELFADPTTYDLGHVRAFLVLSLLAMDQKLWSEAWALIGRAVYSATSIGLLPRGSATASVPCDDGVKRTLLGCATLETILAARLNTIPYFQSSDILLKGPLTIDGIEEWEPWQPKVLIGTKSIPGQRVSNLHMPGHVISTFNRLLKVIVTLNDLVHQRKECAPNKNLHDTMSACQQNLSTLNDLATATDMPPQTLCLWLASAAALETAAAECCKSSGTLLERPDGYWTSFTWLASLPEKQAQSIGRCSISPALEACLVLLQESLGCQQLQYVGTGFANDFNRLMESVSKSLIALQDPSEKDLRVDPVPDSQLHSKDGTGDPIPRLIQPRPRIEPILPTDVISSEILSGSSLDKSLDAISSSLSQGQPSIIVNTQPPALNQNAAFGSIPASLGEDLDDDGLFDSLATLDPTDWLANPPEFMQHLGLLENPPNDIESIFDTEF